MSSSDVIFGLVPLVGSIGTLALAVLAWGQLREVRGQVDIARRGLHTAAEASESAAESAQEVRRSRIDESAPRVLIWFAPLSETALLDRYRGVVQGGEPSLLAAANSGPVDVGVSFSDPGDRNKLLWYQAEGVFINEGKSTARIRLDHACKFVPATEADHQVLQGQVLSDPLTLGSDWFAEYLLRPGDAAMFRWAAGKSVGEWMDLAASPDRDRQRIVFHTAIAATDNSTVDHYYAELHLAPLEQSAVSSSTWTVRRSPAVETTVRQYAPIRIYTAEHEHIPDPPWVQKQ